MPDPLAKPNRPKPNPLEGAALIIVLSCLVLLAALAIGLLNRVEADRSNASAYRGSTLTRNLAEYAINVVMAQISGATKSDPTLAWASQPGAIRTYSASGSALQNIYKLYSSTNMVVSAFPSGDTNLSGWANNSALFTDLNARVVSGTGASARTNYPILDPSAVGSVQGFDIIGAPTTTTQPAPMPVNWLYVLEDGTLVPPTSAAGNNTVTVTGATAANPIVGRIAFWTDDDTSKININTASGAPWNYTNTSVTNNWRVVTTTITPANYWDTPMMGSDQDENLAICQPWGGEYQRYPGHPTSVSLSAVFTNLTTNDIMAIAPRITYQNNNTNVGSQWGSFLTTNTPPFANSLGSVTVLDPGVNPASRMPDDAARLYANVDELLYATNRSGTGTNPVTAQQIERARFFLTASSRAPDVTLFNTPRLLCWPITFTSGNTNKITPYDRLIAFCGTVGANTNFGSTNSYYFTRWDPVSATADYNVSRNTDLMNYLKRLTETPVPGFGGTGILSKYTTPNEPDQIRTQIFDYIRCINTRDMSMATNATNNITPYAYTSNSIMPTAGINNTRGFGRFPTVTKAGMLFWFNNYYTNLVTNAGVVTTNTNVSLCARVLLESFYASHGYPEPNNPAMHSMIVSGLDSLQWGTNTNTMTRIFTNSSSPYACGGESFGWAVGGRRSFAVSGYSTLMAVTATNTNVPATVFFNADTTNSLNTNSTFSFSGGTLTIQVRNQSGSYVNQTITIYLPPFTNLPVPRSTYTSSWPTSVSGSGVTNFSGNSFNGLRAWTGGTFNWTNAINTSERSANLGRLVYGSTLFRPQDVVRSVGVVHGDFRITAARTNVGTNFFAPVNGGVGAYTNTNPDQAVAHNFVGEYPYSAMGARFPRQNYYNTTNTAFTPGTTTNTVSDFGPTNATVNGQYQWRNGDAVELTNTSVTGDWDNGYGNSGNGPYIGFPDEGNTRVMRFTYAGETNIVNSIPYLDGSGQFLGVASGFFSPNRLVPSAGIMGSLPSGVMSQTPWQTLLFRPAPLTSSTHPGLNNPPDYLLLDLFNMPVVEPYAISEPLSTAGRVNMNYQILPFTYIKRSTALRAALHTEWMMTIPTANGGSKTAGATRTSVYRHPLNLDTNTGTLRGFENRFGNNDIFRSAAEICSIPLVPTNSTWTSVNDISTTGFWRTNSGTGDNSKERPYARIYPKLTTKSNTYTVHYRVEVLKKSPNSTTQTTWADGTDKVISTYRGSTTIERYVNPRDSLPDYADPSLTPFPPTGTNALPNFYKFRILGERQFNP